LIDRLTAVKDIISKMPEDAFVAEKVKEALFPYAEQEGRGQVLWPTRYALSGRDKSPDPFQLAGILGKNETLARIDHAISILHGEPQ
jgi:hypothetical protein